MAVAIMELFVQQIVSVRMAPFAVLVELEDGSYGISKIGITNTSRWIINDKSLNHVRYATLDYARKAFEVK
jgi:hypothetical protein